MVNGLPCGNDRTHLLRTRHGHCVECNPASIAFQGRKSQEGFTYLAGSERTKQLKIGMAIDPQRRGHVINQLCYGGASDWKLLALVQSRNCGLIEYETQRILADHQVEGTYLKDGREQACFELFRHSHREALKALKTVAARHGGEVTMELAPDGRYDAAEVPHPPQREAEKKERPKEDTGNASKTATALHPDWATTEVAADRRYGAAEGHIRLADPLPERAMIETAAHLNEGTTIPQKDPVERPRNATGETGMTPGVKTFTISASLVAASFVAIAQFTPSAGAALILTLGISPVALAIGAFIAARKEVKEK